MGRLASMVSLLLQGKTKPIYHPAGTQCTIRFKACVSHVFNAIVDMGDHVVIINTRKVVFTGNKWDDKLFRHHTG